jgi:hypothetical protein
VHIIMVHYVTDLLNCTLKPSYFLCQDREAFVVSNQQTVEFLMKSSYIAVVLPHGKITQFRIACV